MNVDHLIPAVTFGRLEPSFAASRTDMGIRQGLASAMPTEFMLRPRGLGMLAAWEFWDHGSNVFVVGPRLAGMFRRTSLAAVTWEDIQLPFPTFYVALPDCPYRVQGVMSSFRLPGFYVVSLARPIGPHLLVHHPVVTAADEGFVIPLLRDVPLEEHASVAIEGTLDGLREHAAGGEALAGEVGSRQKEAARLCLHIFVNLVLYLNADLPVVETEESAERRTERAAIEARIARIKPRKRRKLSHSLVRIPDHRVVLLGPEVEGASEDPARAGPRQHWVRGHYHRYRCGPGRTSLKLKWTRPFLRGDPARGATEARTYAASEPAVKEGVLSPGKSGQTLHEVPLAGLGAPPEEANVVSLDEKRRKTS